MTMSLQALQNIAETRRSIYVLNDQLPVSNDEVISIVEHAIKHTPSSFNSQSTRIIVLFGAEHQKLWQMTEDALRVIVNDEEKFKSTADKMSMFKAGAGTVLFFEDQAVIKGLQEQFPAYAQSFPVWAEHANAMHQYAIWNALASVNIGANLQHYAPVIEKDVAKTWNVDSNWQLIAQMVFGNTVVPAGEKTFEPIEKRLQVFGK